MRISIPSISVLFVRAVEDIGKKTDTEYITNTKRLNSQNNNTIPEETRGSEIFMCSEESRNEKEFTSEAGNGDNVVMDLLSTAGLSTKPLL